MKWVSCTAAAYMLRFKSLLSKRILSHSKWQGLELSSPLTLLIVDYSLEILGGEDANMSLGAGAELSGDSAVSGHSSNIHGKKHMSIVQKVPSLTQILDMSHYFHFVWASPAQKLRQKSEFL